MNKIFGEFKTIEELNQTALNLRESGEEKEIITLGKENKIKEKDIKRFIEKEIDYLENPKKDENVNKKSETVIKGKETVTKEKEIVQEYKTAVEKIEKELEKAKSRNIPSEPIAIHLIDKSNTDKEFAERVLLKDKNLKGCFNYVYSEARKKIKGSSGWLHDTEVYKIAEDYFTTDKVNIKTKMPGTSRDNTKKDKKKKENNKEKLIRDKKIIEEGQVSLFDI